MKVIRAESLGMCFGVRAAIEMALSSPHRSDLTVLGELVHNADVLHRLEDAGVRSAASLDAPVATSHVMITAHGASSAAVARLRECGLQVHEATCPLVAHAHRSLRKLVAGGYFPVLIGKREHVEVRGLVGDLDEYAIVETEDDVAALAGRPRLGVASQTTQPLDFVLGLVDLIRATYLEAEVRFTDTVCQPTKERQAAARRIASQCEVVLVVGGRNSNNSRQLTQTCEREGAHAYLVESADDVRPEWLEGVERVGLTAGTSTPDEAIEAVQTALLRRAS